MSSTYPKTRLFVEQPLAEGQTVMLDEAQAHYVQHVLRHKEGESLAVFNAQDGEWLAQIIQLKKKQAVVEISKRLREALPTPDVWVAFAPIKFGKIDFLVQKMTELGAARLIPVMTQYTQVDRVKQDRLRANAIEAAQQCERVSVPDISEPVGLRALLADWPAERPLFYGDESGHGKAVNAVLSAHESKSWGILIGPEGGFSPEEHEVLRHVSCAVPVGLGPRILRADTAALTLLAITQAWLGDWDMPPAFRNMQGQ